MVPFTLAVLTICRSVLRNIKLAPFLLLILFPRLVELIWSEEVETYHEALTHEKQIKGWNRAKKEALICGDWDGIHQIVREERKRREQAKK